MVNRPFQKAYLLGYVPSIDRVGETTQIIRVTNGRGTLLTDDPGEVRRIFKGKVAGVQARLFSSALASRPGMIAFVRLARSVYRTNERRAGIKREINTLCGSAIVEEKSYTQY